jgi:hypothetical protein
MHPLDFERLRLQTSFENCLPSIDAYLRAHLEWLGGSRAKES